MANKVDVFTEELSKVFTILQQQYVIIKYMKALIASGGLDETEINKLKEQVTLINNNINTINSNINTINSNIDTMIDQIIPIKQNIERIEQGMTIFDNKKLDKVENRGVTPKVYVTTEGQQTTLEVSLKYSSYNIPRYSNSGTLSVNTPTNGDNAANKDYVDNAIASVSGGGKLYRHDLIITSVNDFQIYHTIYATNNTPITNDQTFATVVKANSDYGGQGMYLDRNVHIQNALIRYSTGKVIVQTSAGDLAPAKSITDTVTPI